MSAICLERLVGHVMAASITSNGLNATGTEQMRIVQRIQAEIKKVEKFVEESAARKKDPQASGGLSPDIIVEAADTSMPADPAGKQRLIDRTVICSVICCSNRFLMPAMASSCIAGMMVPAMLSPSRLRFRWGQCTGLRK